MKGGWSLDSSINWVGSVVSRSTKQLARDAISEKCAVLIVMDSFRETVQKHRQEHYQNGGCSVAPVTDNTAVSVGISMVVTTLIKMTANYTRYSTTYTKFFTTQMIVTDIHSFPQYQ